jgi:hypothetical protein
MKIQNETVKQAVSAINCAQTVAQVGMIKLTGGIALYAARIHEMDHKPAPAPAKVRRDAIGREV